MSPKVYYHYATIEHFRQELDFSCSMNEQYWQKWCGLLCDPQRCERNSIIFKGLGHGKWKCACDPLRERLGYEARGICQARVVASNPAGRWRRWTPNSYAELERTGDPPSEWSNSRQIQLWERPLSPEGQETLLRLTQRRLLKEGIQCL